MEACAYIYLKSGKKLEINITKAERVIDISETLDNYASYESMRLVNVDEDDEVHYYNFDCNEIGACGRC